LVNENENVLDAELEEPVGYRLDNTALGVTGRAKSPTKNNFAFWDADAFRLAALLVGHMSRYYSLLAPCQTGTSTPRKWEFIFGWTLRYPAQDGPDKKAPPPFGRRGFE
jgi:hypothetical protein